MALELAGSSSPPRAPKAAGPARYTQAQLNQYLDAHERLIRRQPNGMRAILRSMELQGMDFSGRQLTESDFTGANLQGANLRNAHFERAALYCADLGDADARDANFFRADIRGVSLRNADLSGAMLDDADMRQAVLARVGVDGSFQLSGRSATVGPDGDTAYSVDFTNCSMKRAKLANAKLKGANFTGAILHEANLSGADLTGATFKGAVLTGVDTSLMRVSPGALDHCLVDPGVDAKQRAAELLDRLAAAGRWVATNGAEGGPAVLDDEDIRPLADALKNRPLPGLSARRICAIGVSFAGSQMPGANFEGADLREADFSEADLRGASFKGANLRGARFDNTNLQPLPLANGRGREVDLSGANYAYTAFAKAQRG